MGFSARMLQIYFGSGIKDVPNELKERQSNVQNESIKMMYFTIYPYFDVLFKDINTIKIHTPKEQINNIWYVWMMREEVNSGIFSIE